MPATTEDPEALHFDSHGGGNRNVAFRVYQQTPARRAATSNAVPFIGLRHTVRPLSRVGGNDYDFARFVDLDASDMHTGRADGFDRSGHVLLPECGRRAGHGYPNAWLRRSGRHRRGAHRVLGRKLGPTRQVAGRAPGARRRRLWHGQHSFHVTKVRKVGKMLIVMAEPPFLTFPTFLASVPQKKAAG